MSPTEAAKVLNLPAEATPEQIEARFLELRRKLEDKIAKAPTPGLQAKYRESLEEIATAFETLTLAADSSALPMLQKQGAARQEHGSAGPATTPIQAPHTSSTNQAAPKKKSGGKEFAIVALVAVVLLAAGGWFVMKTRAENAEEARLAAEAAQLAAEQKAEADRQAAAAKAEQERLALERKRAEEAELARREKLLAEVRAGLAEARVAWDAIEREERAAERRLSELKSDLRSLRDAPAERMAELQAALAAQQRYFDWLTETLPRHPARIARTKAEELVSARQADSAAALLAEMTPQLEALDLDIKTQRARASDLDGTLVLRTEANVEWRIEDAFGQARAGKGPVELDTIAVGQAKVRLRKPFWPERNLTVTISADRKAEPDVAMQGYSVEIASTPEGADVFAPDGAQVGVTPLRLAELPAGRRSVELRKAGFQPQKIDFDPATSGPSLRLTLREIVKVEPRPLGQPFVLSGLEMEMLPLGPGAFRMGRERGRDDERPVTEVRITRPYWLGKTEVTQAQWTALMNHNPSIDIGSQLPVQNILWEEAMEFCRRLTERERSAGRLPEGYEYTLPSEAQWEYACRAGTVGDFAGSVDDVAWHNGNAQGAWKPVGRKRANAWGFHDMHGNASEWCYDWSNSYPGGSAADPMGPASGRFKVIRGGSIGHAASNCSSGSRSGQFPEKRSSIGMRVALAPVR